MDFGFLLGIIIIIAIIILIFKVVKVFLKALFTVIFLLFIIFLLFGFLVYSDAMRFNKEMQGKNLMLISEDIIEKRSGIELKGLTSGFVMANDNITGLKKEELNIIEKGVKDKEGLEDIKEEFNISRIFVIKESALECGVKTEDFNLSSEEIQELLGSNNIFEDLAKKIVMKKVDAGEIKSDNANDVIKQYKESLMEQFSEEELKANIAGASFGSCVTNDPLFIITKLKDGEIKILPKTILFKALEYIPTKTIEKFVKEGINKRVEGIKEGIENKTKE